MITEQRIANTKNKLLYISKRKKRHPDEVPRASVQTRVTVQHLNQSYIN